MVRRYCQSKHTLVTGHEELKKNLATSALLDSFYKAIRCYAGYWRRENIVVFIHHRPMNVMTLTHWTRCAHQWHSGRKAMGVTAIFCLNLSIVENSCFIFKPSQKPMDQEAVDFRGEPTTVACWLNVPDEPPSKYLGF